MVAVVTETNREENKKIDKIKVFSMIIISLLVLLPIIVSAFLSCNHTIQAEIISYEQDEDFLPILEGFFEDNEYKETFAWYDMSAAEAKDLQENPENYRGYYIDIDINNISGQKVFDVEADLSRRFQDIWMNRTGLAQWMHRCGFDEWEIDLEPNEMYHGDIYIIVKTFGITEERIDQLIRSIGITVSVQNSKWLPFVTSETIYFEK